METRPEQILRTVVVYNNNSTGHSSNLDDDDDEQLRRRRRRSQSIDRHSERVHKPRERSMESPVACSLAKVHYAGICIESLS